MITLTTAAKYRIETLKQIGFSLVNECRFRILLKKDKRHCWNDTKTNNDVYLFNVIFIGQTGYGKSSTLNSILREEIFETDSIESCTKKMLSARFTLDEESDFCLCDMPGIGESDKADRLYLEWYRDMIEWSDCVVYFLRADKRDYLNDLYVYNSLLQNSREKTIFAINFVDKIEPLNRADDFYLTLDQQKNLDHKYDSISTVFNISRQQIVHFSAKEKYNITNLVNKIQQIFFRSINLN